MVLITPVVIIGLIDIVLTIVVFIILRLRIIGFRL